MRLDQRMVALGLVGSRAKAQALIKAGAVTIDGAAAQKASAATGPDAAIAVAPGADRWVSRGALKLLRALDAFALSPGGAEALDCGASTGGFTQVLLERGARRVVALDVGHGQLAPEIAADPRVVALSGVNLRALRPEQLPAPPDFITADLSFIALAKALPPALDAAAPATTLVALIKPQFEVGPAAVGKGGVVKDPAARAAAVDGVRAFLSGAGWSVLGVIDSPIAGGDGNREFLIAARRAPT